MRSNYFSKLKYASLLLLSTAGIVLPAQRPAIAATCADFSTQQEAQSYYNQYGGRLDRDNDGVACESLPSGGSYSNSSQPTYFQSAPTPSACRDRLKPDTNVRTGASTSSGIIATVRPPLNRDPITVHSTQVGSDGQNWS